MADVVGISGGVQRGDGGQIRFHTSHSQSPIVSHHIFGGGQSEHPGELIPSKCYTYHSIGELATLISEQQTLQFILYTKLFSSLDLASSSAKLFKFKRQTLLVVQSDDRLDIHLLINQQDLIKNILAPLNLEEEGKRSCLLDYTFLAKSNYLCLLYPTRVTILDISSLLQKSIDQQNPFIVQSIDFQNQKCSRVETDNESLIVVMQKNGGIVQIKTLSNFENYHTYKFEEGSSNRNVRDIHIEGQIMSVLLEKNEIYVFDLRTQQKIFRAAYRDASGQISRLFYINQKTFFDSNLPDSDENGDIEEADINRFMDDEFVGDDEEPSQAFTSLRRKRLPLFSSATQSQQVQSSQFQGHFLLIETLKTKATLADGTGNKTSFEKLIIAKIVNNSKLALEQVDYLKLNEKCKKFVEFDKRRGIVFLLNVKKVQTKKLTLYTIKIKQTEEKGSDSSSGEDSPRDGKVRGMKFSFIKEMSLSINNTAQHKLSLKTGRDKAPYFMKIMKKRDEFDKDQELYFVYTSIAGQILSHQLIYTDLIQNKNKLLQYANNQGSMLATGGSFANCSSILGPDPFVQTDPTLNFDHTSNALSQTLSFGVIPQSDKEREKIKTIQQLNNEELKLDEEQETVNRELQEAIEKELEILNDMPKDNILASPEEVKVTQQPKNPGSQPSTGKEITLNADQIKIIQQQKQQQQQQQQANTSKKKKKNKKPAGTTTPSTTNVESSYSKNNPSSRNPSPQPQKPIAPPISQQITQANAYQQKNAQVSQPVQQKQIISQPQQQKKQQQVKPLEEQMIANFAELTKRYQDLAQKFDQVQEQLQKQSSQTQDLESLVQRSISTVLPTIVEQQMKEKIVPMMISQMKGIDRQINEEVMPQIESQIKHIVNKAIETKNLGKETQQKGKTEFQEEVKQIVVSEFATAMRDGIKPMLQEQFRNVILDVRQSLKQVNDDFSQKLQEEQDKNQSLFEYFKTMLSPQPQQPDPYLMPPPLPYGVPQQYPGYYPYPMPHPGYPQPYSPYTHPHHPQYQPLKPLLSHVASSPTRQHSSGPSFTMSNPPSELNKQRSVQQPLQQQIEQIKPNQRFNNLKESNQTQKNQSTGGTVQSTQIQQQEVLMYDDDEEIMFDKQREESKGSDQNEVKTPESTHVQNIQRSELAMTTASQKQQDFSTSPIQVIDHNLPGPLGSDQLLGNQQLRSQEPKINWDFLPYMKEVATQGKANSADFLLCNAETNNFLRESIFLVQNNSRIITNQYKPKIIHNFIKKVYQRTKENERARKGGLEVISVFLEKIYRKRPEMKQYVQQVASWEEELKKL